MPLGGRVHPSRLFFRRPLSPTGGEVIVFRLFADDDVDGANRVSQATSSAAGGAGKLSPGQILWSNTTDGVFKTDEKGRVLAVNQAFSRLFGSTSEEAAGRPVELYFAEADRAGFRQRLRACLKGSPEPEALTLRGVRPGGQTLDLDLRLAASRSARGLSIYGILTEQGRAPGMAEELEALRSSYWALSETVSDPILQIDDQFRIVFANSAVQRVFGYNREELLRQSFAMLFPSSVYERYLDAFKKYFIIDLADRDSSSLETSVEVLGQNKRKEIVPLELSFGNSKSVRGTRVLTCIVRDITQRKMAERKLRFLAYHDKLTELGNRDLFYVTLNQFLRSVKRYQDSLGALLFLDLDGFKKVNDTLGHNIGDRVLCECARRLSSCLRESDQVYRFSSEVETGQTPQEDLFRFGGDEFVILLTRLNQQTDAGVVAQKIIDALRSPFKLHDVKDAGNIEVGVSIGIALIPGDGTDAMSLIRSADVAMYKAKEQHNKYIFFTAELNAKASERVSLESGLRGALEKGEFELYYQPIVNAFGAIEGAEALLRWRMGEGEFIPPSRFIPVAEETGLILPLGDWVLEKACSDLKMWNDSGHPDFYVSVNLSAKQFVQEDLVGKLGAVISSSGVEPKNLKIEMTETSLMRDPELARRKMEQIKTRNAGLRIAIDDFGTGYSSLSYLSDFPVDLLKIDRSFVLNFRREQNARIINTIIALARNLHMDVVAEGVETVDQYRYLSSRDCRSFQGFYFGKPVCAEEMTRLLREGKVPPQEGSSG
jgi:PAS domain S-box-containing protein